MYCPNCGKDIYRGVWRCENCGADLRRILREEYWSKPSSEDSSDASGSRYKIPETTVTGIGWRNIHKNRGPALAWTIIGLTGLAALIVLLYFAFKTGSHRIEPATEAATSVLSQAEAPGRTSKSPPSTNTRSTPVPIAQPPTPPTTEHPKATRETNIPTPPAATPQSSAPTSALTTEETNAFLKSWLAEWRKSLETKKTNTLTTFYSNSFKTTSGKDKNAFMSTRLKEAQSTVYASIEIGEPEINVTGTHTTVKFLQTYLSDRVSDMGTKTLTIVKEASGPKITAEAFQDATPAPAISADKIKAGIYDWRKAWEDVAINKKLGELPSFYHSDFKGAGEKNRDAWMADKLKTAQGSSIIAVDVQNLRISVLGDKAIASFTQTFKSDKMGSKGKKVLVFQVVKGRPLIVRELFSMEGNVQPIKFDSFWGPK